MSDLTPSHDSDRDGMADTTNAKMPAIAFILAILGLVPTLYAIKYTIAAAYGTAFLTSFAAIGVATGAIVAAAYGARAATRGLASGGRWIAIFEMVIAVLLVIFLFFKQ